MTTTALAATSGVSRSTLVKLQARQFQPSLETIEKLRSVLGDAVDEIDWTPITPRKRRGRPPKQQHE
jgi:predicted transcriptional regulator